MSEDFELYYTGDVEEYMTTEMFVDNEWLDDYRNRDYDEDYEEEDEEEESMYDWY